MSLTLDSHRRDSMKEDFWPKTSSSQRKSDTDLPATLCKQSRRESQHGPVVPKVLRYKNIISVISGLDVLVWFIRKVKKKVL